MLASWIIMDSWEAKLQPSGITFTSKGSSTHTPFIAEINYIRIKMKMWKNVGVKRKSSQQGKIQCVNPGSTITWARFYLGAIIWAGRVRETHAFPPLPFSDQSQACDFFASHANVQRPIALPACDWSDWIAYFLKPHSQTSTRWPYLHVSRARIYALYQICKKSQKCSKIL